MNCIHRGEQKRTVKIANCACGNAGDLVPVFDCRIKGECTRRPTGQYHPWIADCQRCQFNESGLSKDESDGPSIGVSCDESK
jgi:hypothetical protein